MDILNEVENLFKKLEAVSGDIKDAAFRKIVEKVSYEEAKKRKESTRLRSMRRSKCDDLIMDSHKLKSGNIHSVDGKEENNGRQKEKKENNGNNSVATREVISTAHCSEKRAELDKETNDQKSIEEFCVKEEKNVLTCRECSFQTENKLLLHNHLCRLPVRRPHKCHICLKTFSQLSVLRSHMKRHRGERDFPCDYDCKYRAFTKGDKIRHMTQHSGERCHQCHYCGKMFAKDSTLREHVKSIHERSDKHICATCGFSTYRANNLQVHIGMRHRGEYNNHVCPVCGAKVKQRAAFLDHMRSHTGERPYKCLECDSSFTCVARLTVHCKAVHGPREFLCNYCRKGFQTKHHMERHELTHTNKKPFSCPFCSYSCNTQGNVTKHVKGVHNKPDFSYRKYKADQQVDSDCKTVKSEWIEKGEKLTTEYLKDLSKKLGKEVTLSELKKREAEKNKRSTDDLEQIKKRRNRKQEHDYHSKVLPENHTKDADEPSTVMLNVCPALPNAISVGSQRGTVLSEAHVLHGVLQNLNSHDQSTLVLHSADDVHNLRPILTDKIKKESNSETSLVTDQSLQFCVNEAMVINDELPLQIVYSSSPDNTSQENVPPSLNSSGNPFNFLEVKDDITSNQTVVVIINTESH